MPLMPVASIGDSDKIAEIYQFVKNTFDLLNSDRDRRLTANLDLSDSTYHLSPCPPSCLSPSPICHPPPLPPLPFPDRTLQAAPPPPPSPSLPPLPALVARAPMRLRARSPIQCAARRETIGGEDGNLDSGACHDVARTPANARCRPFPSAGAMRQMAIPPIVHSKGASTSVATGIELLCRPAAPGPNGEGRQHVRLDLVGLAGPANESLKQGPDYPTSTPGLSG